MERVEPALCAGVFGCLERTVRIGKEWTVKEGDAEGGTLPAQMLHHIVDVPGMEEFGQQSPSRRRFGMDLHAPPFHGELELLLQFFDDALADVTKRSNIVGINGQTY